MPKSRLDRLLVARGHYADIAAAARAILAGDVTSPQLDNLKPGMQVADDISLSVAEQKPYVSRGGLKLEAALDEFAIDVSGLTCFDIGAGSGGFTDCLLQRGARAVTAIDVGYGQFDWKLRRDSRVTLLERTNFRTLTRPDLIGSFDLAVVDLSFIKTSHLLTTIRQYLKPGGQMIVLVKPQFELATDSSGTPLTAANPGDAPQPTANPDRPSPRTESGFHDGVVSDPGLHEQVLNDFLARADAAGLAVRGLIPSPILGSQGNREFLFWAAISGESVAINVREVVRRAHNR